MTPQTAAALIRALEQNFRNRSRMECYVDGARSAYNYCADRIAAVLTQEGAGPSCPECSATVLYECVACSASNYPPAAQAQDAGPVAHVLVKNGEAIGIMCDVAQDIPDGIYPFYKETRAIAAQDAGPKAKHWRAAIFKFFGHPFDVTSNECDRIEQDARALAEKEK